MAKSSNPDNSRLFKLLEIYQKQNGKGDSYKNVVLELMNGNSFLLLPSQTTMKVQQPGQLPKRTQP